MATIKYKTEDGYVSIPLNIIGSRVYLEDYDDGEVVPELVDDNAKLGNGIGTCSTSSGTALEVTLDNYKLVKNGIVAVTFENDVPANATLNINNKGAKAIYNEGSAIEDNVIKAGKTVMFAYDGTNYVVTNLGGSGDIVWPEFVTINLTQSGGNDSDLIGATVVVTDDDTSETILSTTWQGEGIVLQVEANTDYTVTVGNVTDYAVKPSTQSYTAVGGLTRIIEFTYYGNVVDMGLPSGLLWARKNLDTSRPDGFTASEFQIECSFFSWGNVVGYKPVSTTAFSYDFSQSVYNSTSGVALTGNIPVNTNFDIARNKLGEPWRLPSESEYKELFNNIDYVQADGTTVVSSADKRVTVNGVMGLYLKSKINGNLLFFPCIGDGDGTTYANQGEHGYYWTSTYVDATNAYAFGFHSGIYVCISLLRRTGMGCRPVM